MGYETYQKILAEAMEELGVETGIVTRKNEDQALVDCTIETDQQAMIPDSYIDITAEKIRIYKKLDGMSGDKEIDKAKVEMQDRFGNMPQETSNLFDVVKIRNLGGKLGFEKIIIKNGMMIMFFVSNPMSSYYKTDMFSGILSRIDANERLFNLKQTDGKLKIVSRGIDNLQTALATLRKLN